MEDAKQTGEPCAEENPNPNPNPNPNSTNPNPNPNSTNRQSSRTPFTNLSQVDADLALARTLQEQERAYMMLRMNGEGSDYGSWEAGSYVFDGTDMDDFDDPNYEDYEEGSDDDVEEEEEDDDDAEETEDAFDVHAHAEDEEEDNNQSDEELDPSAFSSDESYARALQQAEERDMTTRLMALAGIHDREDLGDAEDPEDNGANSQDAWEEVDPDELSYEELLALGEVVGTESRGLSADTIASLPSIIYKTTESSRENGNEDDPCVICRFEYEDGDALTVLSCKHSYHSECINNWLKINKVCPVCSTEVSSSKTSS